MRLTAEQFNWRKENRISGAYQIGAPRTFRRGQKGPHCENCGRETEFLFAGFAVPATARGKFIVGEEIKLSRKGRAAGFGRERRRRGTNALRATVEGFCRDPESVRVLWWGNEQAQYYHMDFWEPAVPHDRTVNQQPAMVCFQCRPLSNLELTEQ